MGRKASGPGMLVHNWSAETQCKRSDRGSGQSFAAKGGATPKVLNKFGSMHPAPFTPKRAVTPEDYANVAKRCDPSVQKLLPRFAGQVAGTRFS